MPSPFKGRLHAKEGLLFSYVNSATASYGYLTIFGKDARQQLRWYYPAFEKLSADPISISIGVTAKEPKLLPEGGSQPQTAAALLSAENRPHALSANE